MVHGYPRYSWKSVQYFQRRIHDLDAQSDKEKVSRLPQTDEAHCQTEDSLSSV